MHQALYRKWRPMEFDSVCGAPRLAQFLLDQTEEKI